MNDSIFVTAMPSPRPLRPTGGEHTATHPTQENAMSLIQEALARSHQHEARQRAAEHRLARQLTAGRGWTRLASWAAARAERARTRAA
ncbi:hypothetical protein [Pseudonocardia phyllosphaerae]|uniref:hypothetical protein n=1 Tax=Pseudonocardia phyllosphaerae TaxID=3390502 RepID=UPI00397819B6